MSEIYYALIILPIFFMVVLAFIFSSSLTTINQLTNRIECPFPAISGLWNDTSVVPSGVITYTNATYNWENGGNGTGAQPPATLTCTEVHTAQNIDYYYGASFLSPAVVGWAYFIGDWLSELFANKVSALFTLFTTIINAPAEVTGLDWFTYLNIFFIVSIAVGGFMILRGS